MRTIALRFSNKFALACGIMEAHNELIRENGYVWYGKLGNKIAAGVFEEILGNEEPRIHFEEEPDEDEEEDLTDGAGVFADTLPAFSDVSVITITVAEALMDTAGKSDDEVKAALISSMQEWGRRYPYAGYGGMLRGLKKRIRSRMEVWKQLCHACIGSRLAL